ncbi:cytochrome P450 [Blastococcus sp. SYSU D00820]
MTTPVLWGSDDPQTLVDPYPAYAQLRRDHPWYEHPEGHTVISRYDDVLAALANKVIGFEDDPVAGVAARVGEGAFAENIGSWLLSMNDPRHAALRRLIGPAFMPRSVERLRAGVVDRVQSQFDAVAAAGTADALQVIAFEVPSDVICQLMGIPLQDRAHLAKLTNDVAALLFEAVPGPEMVAAGNDAVRQIDEYFASVVAERRADPGDDLISIMCQVAAAAGDITDYEVLANVHFMYGAGYEETYCFIASGMYHLLTHPGLARHLATDPDGGAAVQTELLRFDTPLQSTLRVVREDTEVNGHRLEAGQRLQLLIGAANRDGDVFPDPDTLRPDRPAQPRIASFGGGVHHCAGHPLARMVSMEIFQEMLRRPVRLAVPAEEVTWRPGSVYRCLTSLPITTH